MRRTLQRLEEPEVRFDWFVQRVAGRRMLFVPRASVASLSPGLGIRSDAETAQPPRWVVIREPQAIEMGKNIEASQVATQLFAQVGPIGCFFEEPITGS